MNSKTPRYRLSTRNLQWGSGSTVPHDKKASAPLAAPSSEGQFYRVGRAIDLLHLPQVGEHLARISSHDLAPWRRSCAWARGWRIHECVMRTPRVIVPFMDEAGALDVDAQEILAAGKEAKRTEDELRALGTLAGDDPGEVDPTTLLGKIAALSIFEKSKWGRTQWVNILLEALSSPEMSYYFAAATNPSTAAWDSLAESMSRSPRFAFAALNLPHLPISAPLPQARVLLKKGVRNDAMLQWALEFSYSGQDKKTLTENILGSPEPSPEACALSIALAPQHARVQEWLSELAGQPQLAYEARRLLSLSGQFDAEFLLAPKLGPIAMADPRWAFHWIRDFSEGDEDAVGSLVPHLEWIAELIDSGVCPIDHATFIDDRVATTMEMDHWLRSSFLLWAASKVEQND